MHFRNLFHSVSKKSFIVVAGVVLAASIVFVIWNNKKYQIADKKIAAAVTGKTDSLYSIRYDSLYFDEVLGNVFLKNIHVSADTFQIKKMTLAERPYIIIDIKIRSIKLKGVKTAKALIGNQLEGDSVVIDQPQVIVYLLKEVSKKTNVDEESRAL
ncbi:MAG: hypothetical protein ABIR19_11655, partial [Ginsengibacter sp.]